MDDTYNWGYYVSHCGENYEKAEFWETFFAGFAKLIVDNLNPKTVLDVGCATGYLVAALRDLGVEAYGMDISQAAISRCREDIRPFLQVHSLLDDDLPVGLPARFDLVTNIEVLEHLYEEETEKAMRMLCSFSDHLLFSSSPDDIIEETHINVRQPEYWAQMFARQGFYRSDIFDATRVTPNAIYFTKREGLCVPRVVEDYEHRLRLLKTLWRPPLPRFQTSMAFVYEAAAPEERLVYQSMVDDQLDWRLPLPAGVQELAISPAHGQPCVAENLVVMVGEHRLEVVDSLGQPLAPYTPVLLPGEHVFAGVPHGLPAGGSLHISGKIHIVEEPYLAVPLAEKRAQDVQLKELTALAEKRATQEQVNAAASAHWQNQFMHADLHASQLAEERTIYKERYEALIRSFSWKAGKPLRFATRVARKVMKGIFRLPGLSQWYRWVSSVRHMGRQVVKFNQKHFGTLEGPRIPGIPPQAELEAQEANPLPPLTISVVSPLFNTPERYLREMIQSLLGQTYPHWELCLADGSDEAHSYVGRIVAQYARKDGRIRYQKLSENRGIAGNTNAAIEMATAEYIALLDHDDMLNLHALYEMRKAILEQKGDLFYSDELTFHDEDYSFIVVQQHKPDFAPDTLRSINYICHFTMFRRDLLERAGGGYNPEYDGSQDYDMMLRMTEKAEKIVHLPLLLYLWRLHQNSVTAGVEAKPYAVDAAQRAIGAHLQRVGLQGTVETAPDMESAYRIRYAIVGMPLVSLIIPNKDEAETLATCVHSIFAKSTYENYEILIVENGSVQRETFACYTQLKKDPRVRVLTWDKGFNYSAINNYAAQKARGEYLLLLNNDTEIITPSWIEEMLMFAQRPDVGAVGAKLYYPDDSLQHGGVVVGMGGLAAHWQLNQPRSALGYMWNLKYARDVGCVTAACLMMRKELFDELEGLNEKFTVAFNDVDLCMRIRKAGKLIVFTPFAELYHYESKSRGPDTTPERLARHSQEVERFHNLWKAELAAGDPYFNKNLSLDTSDVAFVNRLQRYV